MKYRDAIKQHLLSYPTVTQTPADSLYFMLFVNGTGFHWTKDGGIQSIYEPPISDKAAKSAGRESIQSGLNHSNDVPHIALHYKKLQHDYKFLCDHIEEIVDHSVLHYSGDLYPVAFESHINEVPVFCKSDVPCFCIPDNAQKDWLHAIHQLVSSLNRRCSNSSGESEKDYAKVLPEILARVEALLVKP